MKILKRFIDKFFTREIITYLIVGVLTTLVNFGISTLLREVYGDANKFLYNTIAIELSILFAFFANKYIVFQSSGNTLKEILNFFVTRNLISFLFDNGSIWLFEDMLGLTQTLPVIKVRWSKIIGSVLIVIFNYLAGKYITFRKKENKPVEVK